MENYVNLMFSLFLLFADLQFAATITRLINRNGFQAAVLFLLSKVKHKYFKIKFTTLLIS